MKIISAILDEVATMRSGNFIPYHKMAPMVAIVACVIFSVLLSHSSVFEGKIAVIDLDKSQFSTELIEKINTSTYINVSHVYYYPIEVTSLTYNDNHLGVLYIPRDFEKNLLSKSNSMNIGYFADYSNEAQNAEIIESLNEIIAVESSKIVMKNTAGELSLSDKSAKAYLSPIQIKIRRLYNPTFSSTNSTIISFIHFFSSIYLGLTTLMIIGRLRVSKKYSEVILDGFLALIGRLIPYSIFYVSSITLVLSILVVFGQLRFVGNYLLYLPSLFITALSIGVLAYHLSWNSQEPGHGAAFMIFLIPPGFILGGSTFAVGIIPFWGYLFSHIFPLVWQYKFFRDIALRDANLLSIFSVYCMYLSYFIILIILLYFRYIARKKEAVNN